MDLKIRTASVADVPEIHRVRMSVRENRLSDPHRVSEAHYLPYIAENSAWVAEAEGEIAGFAVIDAPARRVWALFVHPDAEGAGIGRALHDRILKWMRDEDILQLSLTTSPGTRAERFYTAAGWKEAGFAADGDVRLEMTLPA